MESPLATEDTRRIVTDFGDTVFITRFNDGACLVFVLGEETGNFMEVSLTVQDINRLAEAIHGHA